MIFGEITHERGVDLKGRERSMNKGTPTFPLFMFENIREKVGVLFGVREKVGVLFGDDISRAKAMICYWGHAVLGIKMREIAARLNISQPAVSKWVGKGCKLAEDIRIFEKFGE